ncbi:3-isopropylmalate dehydrogenase [Bifidobacterium sp. ESL0732]|uniref:3-isopropylmalate dehydrogenase n=1 Tax=Bifidobacterium sp. ESL0732 TaxID=2983222 RepID=UPI0023F748A4|nr:3-isopropylmalate dehydrogenase [Bifidobacterium sp. ESL0732]WEV64321.1 3-isopropylmalate dehydrogenase [Bifidobacterium sp. ESL0732]
MTQQTSKKILNIAVIAGDGIGKEVTPEAQAVLDKAAQGDVSFNYTDYDLGAERYLRDGTLLTDEDLASIGEKDAILLGAVGDPRVTSGILERGLLIKLRFAFDQGVNLRPSKLYPGVSSPLKNPGDIDFAVVREGTEGLYSGMGGIIRRGTDQAIATEISMNTEFGVERAVRYAFELARKRDGKKNVTMVNKTNVLVHAGALWLDVMEKVAKDYPDVTWDYLHADACTIFMATNPSRFDVIVTDNLFGDVLTDLAGAVVGGIGYSASANINVANEHPSMFEPIHGSAPDIAGKSIANPTAAIVSVAMLLEHFGYDAAANRIHRAVEADIAENASKKRSTHQIGQDILNRL